MNFKQFLNESKMKLKRYSAGFYSGEYKGWEIEIYKSDTGFWSSTITWKKYGDPNWREEVVQDEIEPKKKSILVGFLQRVLF